MRLQSCHRINSSIEKILQCPTFLLETSEELIPRFRCRLIILMPSCDEERMERFHRPVRQPRDDKGIVPARLRLEFVIETANPLRILHLLSLDFMEIFRNFMRPRELDELHIGVRCKRLGHGFVNFRRIRIVVRNHELHPFRRHAGLQEFVVQPLVRTNIAGRCMDDDGVPHEERTHRVPCPNATKIEGLPNTNHPIERSIFERGIAIAT
ncbi:hypothetical protein A3H22_00500 [Candidatus Peribacteria bacterium RIFCSPLOWO2_12_FULL_55_15]|nr:MAG: hypothetical protein A2789_02605 [Candidatus Peribacteria bacterium RIFCSPHIGHO2_01_FULL_54_22]OGJ62527.1 MAG: hypothetical protein A3D12_02335 [Candidatus Peribacteria bacterium RIFCSPHIGHO2_02_FULL_55_24]OGJ67428.1 MAG: hypothetical protein A2947_01565 [Candidatus Peribacteria bacterium RIFCSPLOWO2_01_FULL_54_110]OGJ69707.1 MAG: hypothetical protein A3H90_01405 [Candidatus Peribacteria bacterium RIFCSPLOWO2_02_FULL_55_36]OGJ70369.1 MAG: hypothetical protein A3H22_00500 [Candidatus Per